MQERVPASLKASRIEETLIITLLVESIHAGNAHWVKEEILGYLKYLEDRSLQGVIINLHNIKHMGHIGLGALIAVNSQIRRFQIRAFMGIQPEIETLIHRSHLDKIFPLWHKDMPCPICHQAGCAHVPLLIKKETEFLAQDYPLNESLQPAQNEKVNYLYGMPLSAANLQGPLAEQFFQAAEHKEAQHRRNLYIMASMLALVLLVSGVTIGYLSAQQKRTIARHVPDLQEMLEKYDYDRDGKITPMDGKLLDLSSATALMYTPWCKPLGITCLK
jgi:anti-anti-sigma regulatory factor